MTQKYHPLLRVIHWAMTLTILGLIALGWYMDSLPPDTPGKYDLYDWHKLFGVLVLFSWFLRIVVRNMTRVPPLPEGIKPIEKKLSHFVHYAIYAFMIIIPTTGILMTIYAGYKVPILNSLLKDIVEKNENRSDWFDTLHQYFAYTLLALVVLHIAGALKHRFFEPKENDVIKRMV